eukprot:gene8100-12561_t
MCKLREIQNQLSYFLNKINQKENTDSIIQNLCDECEIKKDEKKYKNNKQAIEDTFLIKKKVFHFGSNDLYIEKCETQILHEGIIKTFEATHGQLIQILSVNDVFILNEKKNWLIKSRHFKTLFKNSREIERISLGMTTAQFKKNLISKKKPKRIILMRTGESIGNLDKKIYETIPDNQIKLTPLGVEQSIAAGKNLKKLFGEEKVFFYLSPLERAIETFENIQKSFEKKLEFRIDPRLREQEWGNFQKFCDRKKIEFDRQTLGSFYYRFKNGESGADLLERIITFMGLLIGKHFVETNEDENIVLITHGLASRLFLMKWFHWDVEIFHILENFESKQNSKICNFFEKIVSPLSWKSKKKATIN